MIDVLCVKNLKFDYKSWGQVEGVLYKASYKACHYCYDVCTDEESHIGYASFLIYSNSHNDFCNVPLDTFNKHFKTMEDVREEKINEILF